MDGTCSIFQLRGWQHSTRLLLSCYLELVILLLRNKEYVCIFCSSCYWNVFSWCSCFWANPFTLALNHQVATIQGLSGTGSLRLAAALIERYFPGAKVVISSPTWGTLSWPQTFLSDLVSYLTAFINWQNTTSGNHKNIFNDAKVPWSEYRYYDPKTVGLDFEGMIADIKVCLS